jgi:hypothetical protein
MLEIPQGPNGLILVHKQRENELREHDTGLVRWDWSILLNPAAFHPPAGIGWPAPPLSWRCNCGREGDGAACQNRTDDLLITSEMLYRLS